MLRATIGAAVPFCRDALYSTAIADQEAAVMESRPQTSLTQRRRPPILLTLILWLAIVSALVFWRLVYDWRVGNFLEFVGQDFPRLVLILLVVLASEYFYFRGK
jgi:hypothetical protein